MDPDENGDTKCSPQGEHFCLPDLSTMTRCLFIYSNGEQCPMSAVEGCEFCVDHVPAEAHEPLETPWSQRVIRRAAAAFLLGLFLLQLYEGLKLAYGF
jgi:hypothetical protein